MKNGSFQKRDFTDEDHSLKEELVGLKSHRHSEDFVRDYTDEDLPVLDPGSKTSSIADLKKPSQVSRFNWASFWTMLASIAVVVFLVIFIPGPFDEIAAAIALSAINAFIANYRK